MTTRNPRENPVTGDRWKRGDGAIRVLTVKGESVTIRDDRGFLTGKRTLSEFRDASVDWAFVPRDAGS